MYKDAIQIKDSIIMLILNFQLHNNSDTVTISHTKTQLKHSGKLRLTKKELAY